jgi:hypothetical protein
MKSITKQLVLSAILVSLGLVLVGTSNASAFSIYEGLNAAHGTGQPTVLFGVDGIFSTITNILLFVIGALSVIMLIIGGLRYVVSGGNNTSITAAKNTVLYAVVGLIIAFLAYAAINFILGSLSGTGAGYTNV